MAVAVTALVVALGGTTWAVSTLPANSVGTKQLKHRAVVSVKLDDRAVTRRKLARAAVTSDRLATGAVRRVNIADGSITARKLSGELRSAGIAKLTYVRVSGSLPPSAAVAATAQCPRGTVPIAGGAELPHKIGVFMLDSHPVVGHGWEAGVGNADTQTAPVTIYAICAKARAVAVSSARTTSGEMRFLPLSRRQP
jgi:hypothetical protein